jgi:hypothetical protein
MSGKRVETIQANLSSGAQAFRATVLMLQMVVHVDDSLLSTGSNGTLAEPIAVLESDKMLGEFVSIGGQRVVATVDGH